MEMICQENVPFRYKTNALTVNKKLLFQLKKLSTISHFQLIKLKMKAAQTLSDNLDI